MIRPLVGALFVLAGSIVPVLGAGLPDKADIFLIDGEGKETELGSVTFSGAEGNKTIAVSIESPAFTDQFLSMRPFRCIQSKKEWFCYLPYPYEIKNEISADDLTDLEYHLLFLRKKPAEFGIDAWNGLYYNLTLQENGQITGELLEGDLNVLASPPEKAFSRPIDLDDFIEAEEGKRLFPSLIIR
ncbi:MAG: hypothetical protein ABJN26_08960 [Stappiaceae bacterium]